MKPINTSIYDFPGLIEGGYPTINRRIDSETVLLKIPNEEVRISLYRGYISRILGVDFALDAFQHTAKKTARELFADETGSKFATLLKTAFAKIPHEWLDRDEKSIYVGVNYDPAARTIDAVKTEPAP